jgi:hypothetical protein
LVVGWKKVERNTVGNDEVTADKAVWVTATTESPTKRTAQKATYD